ncbi:hypothetical protein MNBD_NITROSPINAE04-1952 [hydrothermal vent metagenome]|uniref:Mu-like prophage FluMu protein gp29 n=1 Tax=hydrothermal vent metagenome TaxID=652676 RepID=A0A3B1CEX7_9ZZZZ
MLMRKPREGEIILTKSPAYLAGGASRNLTPARLSSILSSLDMGDVTDAMTLFDEMEEKDLHLGAVTQTRKLAVVSKERTVISASDDAEDVMIADFVREVFEGIPRMRETLTSLMTAVSHGFSIAEIIWDVSCGMVTVKDVLPRSQKHFDFVDQNDPSMLLDFPGYRALDSGEAMSLPRDKFIFHRHHGGNGNCLKAGLYRGVAWSYLFTNFTMKDWLTFMDLYGIPLRLGKYKNTADDKAREVLKNAVSNLGSDAAAVISDDTTIEFIQSAVTGNHTLFKEAAEYFNRQKSKRILGQTLTTEASEKGAYSLGQVHDRVRADIAAFDSMALDETLNADLIRPLVDFNFGERKRYPKVVTSLSTYGETDGKLEQLKKLLDLGAKVPARVAAEITGVKLLGDLDAPLLKQ